MAGTIGDPLLDPATDPYFEGFRKGGRMRFVDAFVTTSQNANDPRQVDIAIAAGGGGTLQTAYDGGETITTDAQGAVDLTRGELTIDDESLLTLVDANANPGRSVALVRVTDQNVVAAVNPDVPTVLITKDNITESAVLLRIQSTDAGAVGPILSIFHNSTSPGDNDELGRISLGGIDGGGNPSEFGFVQGIAVSVAAATRTMAYDLHAQTTAVSGRLVRLQGDSAVAEPGLRVVLDRTGDTGPAVRFRANGTWTAANVVYQFEQAAGGSTLFSVVGSGAANALTAYQVAGTQVVSARGAAVADAAGGATIDAEARTAINTLLARLRVHGLIAP